MAGEPHDWLQNFNIAVEVLCPTLALIVTALRVYSRLTIGAFGWDDVCIIVAMVLAIVMAIGTILYMKYLYTGIHVWDIPQPADPVRSRNGMIWIYVVGAVYNPILAIVKQSVLIFLLRLASIKRGVRITVWATAIFNAALMIATLLVVILQCHPVALNWNPNLEGKCINKVAFAVSTAALTIFTDFVALALPFYIFLGLKIDKKKKIGLMIVFLLGLIVTAVGAVRLYYLWPQFGLVKVKDATHSFSYCVAAIEVNLAIIAASGPALWPLLRATVPRLKSSMGRTTGNNYYQGRQSGWTPGNTYLSSSQAAKGGVSSSQIRLKKLSNSHMFSRMEERDSDEETLTHSGKGIQRVTDIRISVAPDDVHRSNGSSRGASDGYI